MSGLLILRVSRTYCEQVYMHQTGSAYFAYILIFFTIFPILMLPIKKLKTSHFIIWLAQRARRKSANTSARIGFLNAGQDHIGLDFSFRSQKKIFFLSYVKSFFGQAYSITMATYWPRSKHTKKTWLKCAAILTPCTLESAVRRDLTQRAKCRGDILVARAYI